MNGKSKALRSYLPKVIQLTGAGIYTFSGSQICAFNHCSLLPLCVNLCEPELLPIMLPPSLKAEFLTEILVDSFVQLVIGHRNRLA